VVFYILGYFAPNYNHQWLFFQKKQAFYEMDGAFQATPAAGVE
jgi:hypothetical protein